MLNLLSHVMLSDSVEDLSLHHKSDTFFGGFIKIDIILVMCVTLNTNCMYIVCCRISKMKQCSSSLKTALVYTISVCQAVLI
jgi:hypothetical protein